MMWFRVCAFLACSLVASAGLRAEEWKSGPQVGEGINGGFVVKCSNGVFADRRCCPVWVRGYDLVALIFAREINDDLTGLVKRIDRQLDESMTQKKRTQRFGVFVILLSGDEGAPKTLKDLASKEGLKQVVLSSHPSPGPKRYRVAAEAVVTVAVYRDLNKVSANFAMKKGELKKDSADRIFDEIVKVLPK